MTKTFKKSMQWLFVVVFAIMLVLGAGLLVKPYVASAEQAVTINVAHLEGEDNEKAGYLQIRMDTAGQTWTNSQNNKQVSELPATVADYTTINGRTLTELQNACTSDLPIIVTLQPADTFSFIRVWVPTDYMRITDVRSFGVLDGWAFNDGANTYTSNAVFYSRPNSTDGLSKVTAQSYTASIGDMTIANDFYQINIDIGKNTVEAGNDIYAIMRDMYTHVREHIYINGESINAFNARLIAEDSKYATPATYKTFPQNSTDPGHVPYFCKPAVVWSTDRGFQLNIFKELVSNMPVLEVTVGAGLNYFSSYCVSNMAVKSMWETTDITSELVLQKYNQQAVGTEVYTIKTSKTYWTEAPQGGCLNEYDYKGQSPVGGQQAMDHILLNGRSLYEINREDDGAYGSEQANIKSGGQYAPILVTMGVETDGKSYIQLHVPSAYPNSSLTANTGNHQTITLTKGLQLNYGDMVYYVSEDVVFENNNGNWTKKANEIATSVTGIVTYANRTDGGNNENFVLFVLSNNDYAGLNTTAITDVSSLYGYIDIGGNVLNSPPNEPFFNVWGYENTVTFRAPGLDANGLQQVNYITIKAGAKFPSYKTQNGGTLTYYVTQEDVTFVHSVPNDVWTVGSVAQEHTVTFTVDGATYHSATVTDGGVVSAPSAPTKAEDANYTYTFKQWTLSGAPYDFSTAVTQDITLVAEFTATAKKTTFDASTVTIGNPRVGGEANELYKVDIVSDSWTIACNYYDFMYTGGIFDNYRKLIFINGVSVYDINANTDDSAYVYSTFPMTGADDATFAKPILIETHAQNGGDPTKITIWIHKTYAESLGDELVVTLGVGYNAYTNDGLTLAENVNYDMMATVEVNDGTKTYVTKLVKGSTLGSLGTPEKPMTETAIYKFDNWYIANTDTVFNAETPITEDLVIEARFIVTTVQLIETEVVGIVHYLKTSTDNWMSFELSKHDYAQAPENYSMNGYAELLRIGFLDKVTLKGTIILNNGSTVSEATLMDIYNSYGPQEGPLLNFWNLSQFAMRMPVGEGVTEITIEAGCFFPSYAYVSGATSNDTRYFVVKPQSFKYDEDMGVFVKQAAVAVDIKMEDGASVRISGDPQEDADNFSGIRFETKISIDAVNSLIQKLKDGEYKSIKFGTLIVPTDYITGGLFTHQWLDKNEFNYLDIESSVKLKLEDGTIIDNPNFPKTEDGYYSFYGSILRLKSTNFDRYFSAVGYVMFEYENGDVVYAYTSYNSAVNSRSASYVAEAAINDRSNNQDDKYQYITDKYDYSPFDSDERDWLEKYINRPADQDYFNATNLTELANKGGTQTITVGKKLDGPYVQLLYSTNVNVWGVFNYTDGSKTANEDFYLQAGTTEHKQYLDLFRVNGVAYGMDEENITMTSITFTNAELDNSTTGEVRIMGMYSYNKTIDTENQEIYLTVKQNDNSYMTVGAHLGIGGALTYLAKTGVYEGVIGGSKGWKNGTVAISTDSSVFDSTNRYKSGSSSSSYSTEDGYYGAATPATEPSATERIDGAVNLINNFDAGRQIQQSWYAQVGGTDDATDGSNGYNRAYCYTGSTVGQYWPYNPVQAGDVVSNPGQIIDYEINVAKGYIYVKARAMDWAKGYDPSKPCENTVEGGVTTKSYMENYYRLKADGTLTVNNTFVDWNGFTDMEKCDWASTELPAVYPVHTLNYYVSNIDGDGSWEDSIEYNGSLKPWSGGTAYHQFANPTAGQDSKVEDWFAWANGGDGNAFGFGVYIPNVERYTSGRSYTSTAYYTDTNFQNSNALPVPDYKSWFTSQVTAFAQRGNILADKGMLSNMQPIEYTYQSAYVSNTSYTAPGIDYRMEAYKKIEYSYVICVDTVNNIRSTFKTIKNNGSVTNAGDGYQKVGLDAWARADKAWTW